MSSAARAYYEEPEEGVVLSPEAEDELERIVEETDEDERAGRAIPWETFRAERANRRAG